MQENLLNLVSNEYRVDSRLLAPELNYRHRIIIERVDQYSEQMKSLGLLPEFTEARLEGQHGGGATRYFLLTLMQNNSTAVKSKLKLVKAFRDARKQLAERDIARLDGKQVRRLETDAIKDLIEYAKASGSSRPEMYYVSLTTMTNKSLGIESGQRDKMDARQLQLLKIAETLVEIAIRDGLKAELHYKDIYRLCKDRVSDVLTQLKLK